MLARRTGIKHDGHPQFSLWGTFKKVGRSGIDRDYEHEEMLEEFKIGVPLTYLQSLKQRQERPLILETMGSGIKRLGLRV